MRSIDAMLDAARKLSDRIHTFLRNRPLTSIAILSMAASFTIAWRNHQIGERLRDYAVDLLLASPVVGVIYYVIFRICLGVVLAVTRDLE